MISSRNTVAQNNTWWHSHQSPWCRAIRRWNILVNRCVFSNWVLAKWMMHLYPWYCWTLYSQCKWLWQFPQNCMHKLYHMKNKTQVLQENTVKQNNNNNYDCWTAFDPGQPGQAGTRRNIHPLTPIRINVLPLSPFSICNGPWHLLYSTYVLDSPHVQPLSRSSLVFLLVLNPQLHTPYISSETR